MKALLVLLFCLVSTITNAEPLRIYVLYGQGSIVTSPSMDLLVKKIRKLDPQYTVTIHNWKNYEDVVNSIRKLPVDKKVVIMGYSLGANTVTWIPNMIPDRDIELAVAYDSLISSFVDPSILSFTYSVSPNIKRFMLYDTFGEAYFTSQQIGTTEIRMLHPTDELSKKLHIISLEAIKKASQQRK